ncbi:SCO family protein [Undibacterium sp. Xuan67W]|uniref:SCO family protein n=1 Tax=Undibacterium sp. Xuan67W TaxID=3413057 RepID=UPI003BEFD1FB
MEKPNSKHAGRWKLLLVLAVCAAPMLLSYLFYFVIKPEGRTNYGVILDPRSYPMPKLDAHLLGGESKELDAYKGKWILLQADSGECADACKKKMYDMRQLRLIQGKEMDRIERVWLITDNKPVDTVLIREYDGMRMLSVSQDKLKSWLPVDANTVISDHIYMIDPLGNLMMRFPKDADPNKVKKDIGKLLKASAIG